MRLAIPVLVALTAFALVGCSGGSDETATPVPVAERFVTADDAPGSKPDPIEKRQTTKDFAIFIPALSDFSINPNTEELNAVFEDAGFEESGVDTRFFGETHSPETSPHVFSSFIELGSEDAATSALDWLEADQMKPCPMSCAVQRSSFVVDVPGARGVHRVATAEDIERVGTNDERPEDSYWIGFTVGPVVYTMHLQGLPGAVTEEQAQQIAAAYHERLTAGT